MILKSIPKNLVFSSFLLAFSLIFLVGTEAVQAQKKYVIVLDPGHGGKDPGNLGNGYREKDIVLKVAKIIGKELSKREDIKVIYTRTTDVRIDLWKRGEIANEAKADIFVSIHCDSHWSKAFGAGTFVLGLRGNKENLEIAKRENAVVLLEDNYKERYKGFDPNSAQSVIGLSLLQEENLDNSLEIASLVQYNFAKKLKRKDRKVKQANFQVLRETIMPSVLVELGFLTNKKEGRFLNTKSGQLQMGRAVANALMKYVDNLKLNTIDDTKIVEEPKKKESDVVFKVQIASGKRKIATKSYNFKGLKNVERVKIGAYYKYYYGHSKTYEAIEKNLSIAKKKGYTSAFVVAVKNGKLIPVSEAKKLL